MISVPTVPEHRRGNAGRKSTTSDEDRMEREREREEEEEEEEDKREAENIAQRFRGNSITVAKSDGILHPTDPLPSCLPLPILLNPPSTFKRT
ncbi:hypothetical protein PBY51_022060 [Eleginops maclovinus]|uniref:Uncharacterized protein n=1 Tax=Eleginops maclovinus TaxID=56733 RepID=A0AAN7XA83_ELEMC|nr:hypothetical protein PBY51_022060 [Eleginops maclovinus]